MSKIVIANWKMNPSSLEEGIELAKNSDENNVVICPPFLWTESIKKILTKAALGAQNVFWEEEGAFTGEVSPKALSTVGTRYVIVGHSERRRYLQETDGMIHKKMLAALKNNLIPVLCVGETGEEREGGKKEEVVSRELHQALTGLPTTIGKNPAHFYIAYEPIWALSTTPGGHVAEVEDMVEMTRFIEDVVGGLGHKENVEILYGGSVKSENVEAFLKEKSFRGVLVGGASLKPEEIKKISEIAKKYE